MRNTSSARSVAIRGQGVHRCLTTASDHAPGTVVVHFQDAAVAHGAVMSAIRFDEVALFADPETAAVCASGDGDVSAADDVLKDGLSLRFSGSGIQGVHVVVREPEVARHFSRLRENGLVVGPESHQHEVVERDQENDAQYHILQVEEAQLDRVCIVTPAQDGHDEQDG